MEEMFVSLSTLHFGKDNDKDKHCGTKMFDKLKYIF